MKRKMSMMSDSGTDDNSCNNIASHDDDFMFGFNDSRFSDRELVVEILEDDRSGDLQPAENGVEASSSSHTSDSQESLRVTKLHVSSLLLAAKSPFFRKLFMDSTMELANQRCVTVRIQANEEAAFMEILNYMYSGALTSQTAPALLDVLKLADKFQVVSCMRRCTSLLLKLPVNAESALLYLDLTSSLTMNDEVRALVDAAKQFLIAQYKDINNVGDEIKHTTLAVIEVILSSDVVQVSCEDDVFDFAHSWVESRYPRQEDQRRIFSAPLHVFGEPEARFGLRHDRS